jgi:hypothetical protein
VFAVSLRFAFALLTVRLFFSSNLIPAINNKADKHSSITPTNAILFSYIHYYFLANP